MILEQLQANQTLLLHLWLLSVDSLCVRWEKTWHRWNWGWISGAAADGLVLYLIHRVIDEAVGSRFTAVLNTDSQLCRGQGLLNTIYIHTECVGVWKKETLRITLRIIIIT